MVVRAVTVAREAQAEEPQEVELFAFSSRLSGPIVEGLDEDQRLECRTTVRESTVAAEPVPEASDRIFFLVGILQCHE